jgi:hypothetical protein
MKLTRTTSGTATAGGKVAAPAAPALAQGRISTDSAVPSVIYGAAASLARKKL